jgi:hypothetical protein
MGQTFLIGVDLSKKHYNASWQPCVIANERFLRVKQFPHDRGDCFAALAVTVATTCQVFCQGWHWTVIHPGLRYPWLAIAENLTGLKHVALAMTVAWEA